MWSEKRPHEWIKGVLGVLGLAPSTHISQIKQKVLKGYTCMYILESKISQDSEKLENSEKK